MGRQDVAISRYFAELPDPRVDRTKKHLLLDILLIAFAAVICGADSWEEVECFGKARQAWLKRFLKLPNGIPSHDTFNRVFAALDAQQFAACFARWMTALWEATGLRPIAVDGKSVRAAAQNTFSGCLHLVSAWATENHLILGQQAVAEGSNEITAIPELLRVLELKGALVTIDAAGCQVEIARQIRAQGGHYLLAVKGNQAQLLLAVQAAFEQACTTDFKGKRHDSHETSEDAHGRHEERYVTVLYDPQGLPPEWPDVAAVVLVGREREVDGKNTSTTHFYITSLAGKAATLGRLIRDHWGIENGLHWTLDVAFREDGNRTRSRNAGANLGLLRRAAVSLLKQDARKGSIKAKRLNAALDKNYLLRVLQGFSEN